MNEHLLNIDAPLVVKIGGAALDEPEACPWLWPAIANLHRSLAGGIVLVHGGGKAVDRHLDKLGFRTQRRDGIRITPDDQIHEVVAVLAGKVNKALTGLIQSCGVPAVGLCLGDGRTCTTVKAQGFGFDPGRVGEVTDGDPTLLHAILDSGCLPVIAPIGFDEAGLPLNVNADDAAGAIVAIVGAAALVLLTDVPGVLDESGNVVGQLGPDDVERLIQEGVIHGGMIPKVRGAQKAAQAANAPAIIASWTNADALTRLARGQSVGTQILPASTDAAAISAVEQVRSMEQRRR